MEGTGGVVEQAGGETLAFNKERGSKVESNIRYLQPREFLVAGFIDFVARFTDAGFMRRRFEQHLAIMRDGGTFVPDHAVGYGSLPEYLRFQFSSLGNLRRLWQRGSLFLRPDRFMAVIAALSLVVRHRRALPGLRHHFTVWLFLWSNLLLKYKTLRPEDFKIRSMERPEELDAVWRDLEGYTTPAPNADGVKVAAQEMRTRAALAALKARLTSEYTLKDFK